MQPEPLAKLGISDKAHSSDQVMLRQGIMAEYDAINLYEQMAQSTTNKQLKEVFLHVAEEEKKHIGEFEAFLETLDKDHRSLVDDGKSELKKRGFKEWVADRSNSLSS